MKVDWLFVTICVLALCVIVWAVFYEDQQEGWCKTNGYGHQTITEEGSWTFTNEEGTWIKCCKIEFNNDKTETVESCKYLLYEAEK